MLTKQDKEDIGEVVVKVIQDVVMPAFETVALKSEMNERFNGVENRLGVVENRLEVVERKLDKVLDNQIVDRGRIEDHDKRIKKLESRRISA